MRGRGASQMAWVGNASLTPHRIRSHTYSLYQNAFSWSGRIALAGGTLQCQHALSLEMERVSGVPHLSFHARPSVAFFAA